MAAEVDATCARAVDAIVDGLPIAQKFAVCYVKLGQNLPESMPAVYRTRSVPELFASAKLEIGKQLKRRGIEGIDR